MMENIIKPPIMITAITGHLQYVAAMQLSQLEKAVLKFEKPLSASEMTPRASKAGCTALAIEPHTPPLKLLAIITSIVGILMDGVDAHEQIIEYRKSLPI